MFNKKSLDFLESLMSCSGPSGFEEQTAAVFRDYLSGFADKVYTDVTGNTIGIINEKSPMKVMLAGHYDEIGYQITFISDEGLLHFRSVGGIDKLVVPGSEVEVLSEKGCVHGVIGKKPIHLQKNEERDKAIELKDLWIDIGAEDKKDAAGRVKVGDAVAMRRNFQMLGKHRIKSKGTDDKVGAFVVAETLRELSLRKPKSAVYCVGTVQEELGLRGASASAFGIAPQVGFAVDVTFSTDIPDVPKKEIGDIRLGKGPVIARNADNNPVLGRKIREVAKKKKIICQEEAGFRASGGTDTSVIQLTRGGVATALVSIPNRYMHSPVEICDLRDIEGAVKLLTETIMSIKPGDSFIPGID
ncbi:MAG: M42 family metallopeptidase [Victivallales bacterium]|nr:M42 family metallopeptidase [Victivallales bacterium]